MGPRLVSMVATFTCASLGGLKRNGIRIDELSILTERSAAYQPVSVAVAAGIRTAPYVFVIAAAVGRGAEDVRFFSSGNGLRLRGGCRAAKVPCRRSIAAIRVAR